MRLVESRMRLSNVESYCSRCNSTIVLTNVESSTEEVGIFVPGQPMHATIMIDKRTAKRRAIIGCNATELPHHASTGFRCTSVLTTNGCRRHQCSRAPAMRRDQKSARESIGGYPIAGLRARTRDAMWIMC